MTPAPISWKEQYVLASGRASQQDARQLTGPPTTNERPEIALRSRNAWTLLRRMISVV